MDGYELENGGYASAAEAPSRVENEDLDRGDVGTIAVLGGLFGAAYALTWLVDRAPSTSEQKVHDGFDYSPLKGSGSWGSLRSGLGDEGHARLTETSGYFANTHEMASTASQLRQGDVMGTIVSDAHYVKEHIGMNGYFRGVFDVNVPETAARTYQDGTGVCVEHATLFTALAREQGIPALVRVGEYHGGGHAWAEVPVPTASGVQYLIVDPTNNYVGPYAAEYVHSFDSDKLAYKLSDALAASGNIREMDSFGKVLLFDPDELPDLGGALRDPAANLDGIRSAVEHARAGEPSAVTDYGQFIADGVRYGAVGLASYGLTSRGKPKSLGGAAKAVALGIAGGAVAAGCGLLFGVGHGLAGLAGAAYAGRNTAERREDEEE
jgi:hypothetical protein